MKKSVLFIILILPFMLWQCATHQDVVRYTIASNCVDCFGVAPQKCMLVKKGDASNWELFYSQIEGFNYEPGYEYVLEVKEEKVEHPAADASSIKYVLVKEVSKIAKTATPEVDGTTDTSK